MTRQPPGSADLPPATPLQEASTDAALVTIGRLVEESLRLWCPPGAAIAVADVTTPGTSEQRLEVRTDVVALAVRRAPADLPLRWLVEIDGRERGAASVVGVVRIVREAIDPAWRPRRLRIAARPDVP